MSKPRSRLFDYAGRRLRTVHGFTTAIHFGKQAKHMVGQPNHDPGKSTLTLPLPQMQELLELKAGTGTWRGSSKEIIDFEIEIGIYRDVETGERFPTTRGTVHYSKTGTHVVPAPPSVTTGRRRQR